MEQVTAMALEHRESLRTVTKEAQIVAKTLQISGDNKSANECQNCRKVTAGVRFRCKEMAGM
ncbi:hypothetical protein VI06_18265 [Aquitalea magnusonii]|nr:hypothetical protein VI06_18265 [Aquitalea magnusonii]